MNSSVLLYLLFSYGHPKTQSFTGLFLRSMATRWKKELVFAALKLLVNRYFLMGSPYLCGEYLFMKRSRNRCAGHLIKRMRHNYLAGQKSWVVIWFGWHITRMMKA